MSDMFLGCGHSFSLFLGVNFCVCPIALYYTSPVRTILLAINLLMLGFSHSHSLTSPTPITDFLLTTLQSNYAQSLFPMPPKGDALFDAFNDTAIYMRGSPLPRHGTENFLSLEELVRADKGLWEARKEREELRELR